MLLKLMLLALAVITAAIFIYFLLKRARARNVLPPQQDIDRWISMPARQWSDDFLEAKRHRTDPLADGIVAEIFKSGALDTVNGFYQSIRQVREGLPEGLPPAVRQYFEMGDALPAWADPAMIQRGEQFYAAHGAVIAFILCNKSLPECYLCAKGAQVLYQTGKLLEARGADNPFSRRIAETAQFVVNMMSPGGVSPCGEGIRTAQKVRLIHAAQRYHLRNSKAGWDAAQYDEPINQENMAGTLMAFSALIIEGMELLSISMTDDEKECYYHSWRVAGYYMGIDEDLLPDNAADALALGHKIVDRQKQDSVAGRQLTAALMQWMKDMTPGTVFDGVVNEVLRYFMGDEYADMLGVEPPAPDFATRAIAFFEKYVGSIERDQNHLIIRAIVQPMKLLLLNGMLRAMNDGEKVTFYIPPSLQADWGLHDPVMVNGAPMPAPAEMR